MASTGGAPSLHQNEVAKSVNGRAPAWRDRGGCVELLDDGGARQNGARIKLVTFVERRRNRVRTAEPDVPLPLAGVPRGAGRRRSLLTRRKFRHFDTQAQSIAHDLHWSVFGAVTVNL